MKAKEHTRQVRVKVVEKFKARVATFFCKPNPNTLAVHCTLFL